MASNPKVAEILKEQSEELHRLMINNHSVLDIHTVKAWVEKLKKANQ